MLVVRVLEEREWPLLRDLRIAALTDSTEAFGGSAEIEAAWPDADWQQRMVDTCWLTVEDDGVPVALVGIDAATEDRRADAWVWSWWIAPTHRGRGIARRMLEHLAGICQERGWESVALGAYLANTDAIRAYEHLGFTRHSDPLPSRSRPGTDYQPMMRSMTDLLG